MWPECSNNGTEAGAGNGRWWYIDGSALHVPKTALSCKSIVLRCNQVSWMGVPGPSFEQADRVGE
jgi:hypothetical protein